MKRSKYVGKEFTTDQGTWVVNKIYLAANYCHGTKHNAYRYSLIRLTSDKKFLKKITVSGPTMKKISLGRVDLEKLSDRKGITKTSYEFLTEK